MSLSPVVRTVWQESRDYFLITIGLICYAVGVTIFMLPYGITSGGVAGVSLIVFYATGIEVQVTYLFINATLLVFAIKILGWKFCIRTIYGVSMLTFLMWGLQRLAEDQTGQLPMLVGDQRFMACVIGALFEGTGLAFCFLNNGSTGGTDIIAAIVNKYKNVSLGNMLMLCDVIIISSCYPIFHDWDRVVFGFATLSISNFTLDYIMNHQRQSVQFMIFSRNYRRIADAINATGRGVTVLDGEGWYTKTERKVIVTLVRRSSSVDILRLIKSIDPYSFVSMGNVQGVYGEGFDTIKAKRIDKRRTLVFATNNEHKLQEVRQMLGEKYDIRSLKEIGCLVDIPETGKTFRDNALQKAQYVKRYFGFDVFADDTGLECEALDGAPGVYSARYADDKNHHHDDEANMDKLLRNLDPKSSRRADFRTVIAFVQDGCDPLFFEGRVDGQIIRERRGTAGFGYDPIFQPDGSDKTFAEMDAEQKNALSHRGRAVEEFVRYLSGKKD